MENNLRKALAAHRLQSAEVEVEGDWYTFEMGQGTYAEERNPWFLKFNDQMIARFASIVEFEKNAADKAYSADAEWQSSYL